MLLRFQVSNHRSISEPVELSMIAVDEDRPAARRFDLLPEAVLTTAGIYGPNASGKSNVLEALGWLSTAVGRSLRAWEDTIPREPFKFGNWSDKPSTFEVDMVVEGIRYSYQVKLNDREILYESLYSYPKRQPRQLFEREGLEITFRRGLGGLAGTRELLTPTTLAISAAMRFVESEVRIFGTHLRDVTGLGFTTGRSWQRLNAIGVPSSSIITDRIFEASSALGSQLDESHHEALDLRTSALALLRFADLGIYDVQVIEDEQSGNPRSLRLVHRISGQEVPFDLSEESAGTRTWFNLIGPALEALRTGRVVLFDEIDASLHPKLSARLLELFQDPATNPLGAQLIFTTHDTSLLNFLNRDEVWLTEKGDDGATTLTGLAEFGGDKVRRSLNLEKAYLQGRFGAVPELDQFMLRQALGMAPDDA